MYTYKPTQNPYIFSIIGPYPKQRVSLIRNFGFPMTSTNTQDTSDNTRQSSIRLDVRIL